MHNTQLYVLTAPCCAHRPADSRLPWLSWTTTWTEKEQVGPRQKVARMLSRTSCIRLP